MAKLQCWEFKKCGQDRNASCPAVVQSAGRSCWLVAGTLCGGVVQGDYARKISNCKDCDYYIKVKMGQV